MSAEKILDVTVNEDGSIRFIYDDDLADLIPAGYTCPIQRASEVEPTPDGRWTADMTKAIAMLTPEQRTAYEASLNADQSRTLRMLGPFVTRAEALAAEVAWLKEWAGV